MGILKIEPSGDVIIFFVKCASCDEYLYHGSKVGIRRKGFYLQ
jgi:hypothetical protein